MALQDIPQQPINEPLKKLLIREFKSCLNSDAILTQPSQLKPFETDSLSAYSQLPLLVVSPSTTEQVQQILKICHKHQVPIVPRGNGTGLSGGSIPHPNGVTLNFSRMNRILEVDPETNTAVAQAGVRNFAITEAATPYNLYFAPDPSSQTACSIGGNLAENSGGLHCLKYGLTINNILGAKIVLIDGEIMDLGGKALQQNGYDLLALIIGSEGLLGVVTEITVQLLAKPQGEKLLVAGFKSVTEAANCVADIIAAGIIPAALEMMDEISIIAANQLPECSYPKHCQALLLCELDGTEQEIDEQLKLCQEIAEQQQASHIEVSESEQQRQQLWLGRKSAFPAMSYYAPDYYCLDGAIPRHQLATVLNKIKQLSEQYQLKVANVFHAGDGNLHPLILFDDSIEGQINVVEELGDKILTTCVDAGGTISGEHGVGLEKIGQMCHQFNHDEINQFHSLKTAFDALGLMNPGKTIPTLHRCAEYGAMHISHKTNPTTESTIPRF